MTIDKSLAGKVALVTGASRNIGRAIAKRLSDAGASVVLAARSDANGLQEGVDQIVNAGGQAALVLADVSDEAAVRRMVDHTISSFGHLDILVNNAALRIEESIEDMSYESWRAVTSVILDGSFICSRAALPYLVASGAGAIINIGGLTGHAGAPNRAHVVAAKAGLIGLTKACAIELALRGVTVNLVVPGRIRTARGASAKGMSPVGGLPGMVGRRGEPEEIAAMVCMLAGPDARYITGQTVHVNGGSFMP